MMLSNKLIYIPFIWKQNLIQEFLEPSLDMKIYDFMNSMCVIKIRAIQFNLNGGLLTSYISMGEIGHV